MTYSSPEAVAYRLDDVADPTPEELARQAQMEEFQQAYDEHNRYSLNRAMGVIAENAAAEVELIPDARPYLSLVPDLAPEPVQLEKDENWQERALCAQTDPEAFFPEKGGSTREAKRICQGCEVRDACLITALENDERFGIWGGLSERERRRLKRGII